MRETDRDAYEQHLLFCPPCLAQNDKARIAFSALISAPTQPPPEPLVAHLGERIVAWTKGT